MAKRRTLRGALFTAFISMLVCVSMFVGTTFAWFTDSVTSGKNQIVAGYLDVDLLYWTDTNADDVKEWESVSEKTDVFSDVLWEPGRTEVVYLKIANEGNLAMKYKFTLDIFGETVGKTKDGKDIKLSDILKFGIVEQNVTAGSLDSSREQALASVQNAYLLNTVTKHTGANGEELSGHYNGEGMLTGTMTADAEDKVFAIVLWMPETVANEANHDGTNVPSVDLGVTLVATQIAAPDASLPVVGTGTTAITGAVAENLEVRAAGAKVASLLVPKDAIADGETEISMSIDEASVYENITVNAGETAKTYEVKVEGIKDSGNDTIMTLQLRVGEGNNITSVYHYGNELQRDPENGEEGWHYEGGEYLTIFTKSFSPFTLIYSDEELVYPNPNPPSDLPKATVVRSSEYEGVDLEWGSYGQWSPTEGLDSQLQACFTFTAPDEDLNSSPYADWYCDFFVMLDKELGENEIFLGGNYGSFGWVGFHNGDLTLEANTEIGLLTSVTTNPWTYTDVANNVGTFICGVGDVGDALKTKGATFTVMLRLINPDNEEEYYNVSTITYNFATGEITTA